MDSQMVHALLGSVIHVDGGIIAEAADRYIEPATAQQTVDTCVAELRRGYGRSAFRDLGYLLERHLTVVRGETPTELAEARALLGAGQVEEATRLLDEHVQLLRAYPPRALAEPEVIRALRHHSGILAAREEEAAMGNALALLERFFDYPSIAVVERARLLHAKLELHRAALLDEPLPDRTRFASDFGAPGLGGPSDPRWDRWVLAYRAIAALHDRGGNVDLLRLAIRKIDPQWRQADSGTERLFAAITLARLHVACWRQQNDAKDIASAIRFFCLAAHHAVLANLPHEFATALVLTARTALALAPLANFGAATSAILGTAMNCAEQAESVFRQLQLPVRAARAAQVVRELQDEM